MLKLQVAKAYPADTLQRGRWLEGVGSCGEACFSATTQQGYKKSNGHLLLGTYYVPGQSSPWHTLWGYCYHHYLNLGGNNSLEFETPVIQGGKDRDKIHIQVCLTPKHVYM